MSINSNTLRTDIWKTINDYIYDNIVDPKTRGKQWIFAAMPKVDDRFPGYPIIIMPNLSIDRTAVTFDNSFSDKVVRVPIQVYAKKSEDLDNVIDKIEVLLKNVSSIDNSLTFIEMSQNNEVAMLDNDRIHFCELVYLIEVAK